MVLAIGIVLWGFARLAGTRVVDALTVLGAVALGVVSITSTIDYLMHFPAIPIAVAALVGSACTAGSTGPGHYLMTRPVRT
jgi:hypothetical protein